MFQPKRFVRVKYNEGGIPRVFYGFSANQYHDERVTKGCLDMLKERADTEITEVCVVTMGYGCVADDVMLEYKEVPVGNNGDTK